MIFTVTMIFNDQEKGTTTVEKDYEFSYSMDAVNTALDDNMDALNNLKGGFALICKVKGE